MISIYDQFEDNTTLVFDVDYTLASDICVKSENGVYFCDEDLAFEIVKDKYINIQ